MTSAMYGAFADVKLLAKKKENSFVQGMGEEEEELDKDVAYRERRNSGDSVASFVSDVRGMDYQVRSYGNFLGEPAATEETGQEDEQDGPAPLLGTARIQDPGTERKKRQLCQPELVPRRQPRYHV
jgi:hypothetical protein